MAEEENADEILGDVETNVADGDEALGAGGMKISPVKKKKQARDRNIFRLILSLLLEI